MNRKFSLGYLTIPGTAPVDQIKIAKEAGYDGVSLRTIPLHLPGEPEFLLHQDKALFDSVKQALKDYDLPLMDIELARVRKDVPIEDFAPAFEKAAELGAKDVLGSVWTRDRAWYTETAGRIADMAKQFGLNYNLEFLPWAGVRNLQEMISLVDDLARDNVFILVDTLHAGRAGVTASELARTDPKYFRFMHLCDGPAGPDGDPVLDNIKDELMLSTTREARLYPGEGVMDIAGMVKAMPPINFTLELPNTAQMNSRGALGHAKQCLDVTKDYLKTHGVL